MLLRRNINILVTLLLIFLVFLFTKCKSNDTKPIYLEYQNDKLLNNLGIGLVQQVEIKKNIELYKDYKLTNKLSYDTTNIIPIFYKPDYGIVYFVCLENNPDNYKIILSNWKTAYIKKSSDYKFFNWVEFIKNSTEIESKDLKKYPARININGEKINLQNLDEEPNTKVLEIKGDWIKIEDTTNHIIYWLQWKENNNLLITISLLI